MSLVLPLRRLEGTPLLHDWATRVREAAEAMLLLDRAGRLVALSRSAGQLLGLDPAAATGAMLLDLVEVIDSGGGGVPYPDLQLPPLRAHVTGRVNRGYVRLRTALGQRSYDVVGIPLADGAGSVGFLTPL